MRQPDIAIDASRADSSMRTGTEWYSFELLRAMIDIPDRPGLVLYHRVPSSGPRVEPNTTHRVVRMPRLWTHLGLSWAMLRDRPRALFVPSHVIPAVHPRASVVTIHDLGYVTEPGSHTRASKIMLDLTTRWNARVARRVIAISSQTRDDLVKHYRVPQRKIRVVLSGVNHDRFRPLDAGDILASAGIPRPYLFFLSTVQPRKNVERLVTAFERLDRNDLHLVIAGQPGWLSEPIERRMRESPKRDRIVRLGHVPNDLVAPLYNGAEAFLLPSLYEGFGMGVLEAMACGCPVVTSNVSSLPEVAGDAAILVDPYDPDAISRGIMQALQPETRIALRDAGLRRAADFTWDRTARQTLSVISEAIGGN